MRVEERRKYMLHEFFPAISVLYPQLEEADNIEVEQGQVCYKSSGGVCRTDAK